jgi:hypothetical protein
MNPSRRVVVSSRAYWLLPGGIICFAELTGRSKQFNSEKTLISSDCESLLPRQHFQPLKEEYSSPSWLQKFLHQVNLATLPIPRIIYPKDYAFNDSTMRNGIRQRQRDEVELRKLALEIQKAKMKKDMNQMRELFDRVTEVAYGKGITPQIREDFLTKYGCSGWTDDILDLLIDLGKDRGYIEMAAGHGQWARALTDRYNEVVQEKIKGFDFVLAYDDMSHLPLSTDIYHKYTQPANDFFFSKVQKCTDIASTLRQWTSRGRILLIVYPPPGNMALETIQEFVSLGAGNDTVVYVGEGRGGATANDDLFHYLENGDWVLLDVRNVKTQPGGKGYERLYILKYLNQGNEDV